jgi:hypothetical protein
MERSVQIAGDKPLAGSLHGGWSGMQGLGDFVVCLTLISQQQDPGSIELTSGLLTVFDEF